jgi:hypothetical protein
MKDTAGACIKCSDHAHGAHQYMVTNNTSVVATEHAVAAERTLVAMKGTPVAKEHAGCS